MEIPKIAAGVGIGALVVVGLGAAARAAHRHHHGHRRGRASILVKGAPAGTGTVLVDGNVTQVVDRGADGLVAVGIEPGDHDLTVLGKTARVRLVADKQLAVDYEPWSLLAGVDALAGTFAAVVAAPLTSAPALPVAAPAPGAGLRGAMPPGMAQAAGYGDGYRF